MKHLLPLLASTATLLAAEKPNVLFIFSDDQSYETIRALGHLDIDTPNLDRLVESGTTFTHAYNMGAWQPAVCVASRSMLVTGRTLWRAHHNESKQSADVEAGRFWPQRMAAQGYETYFSGKWHVNVQRAVIHDGWKLILYPQAKVAKLFNLTEDPQETNDLAADPAMVTRKKALFAKFRELQERYDDPLDLEAVYPYLK